MPGFNVPLHQWHAGLILKKDEGEMIGESDTANCIVLYVLWIPKTVSEAARLNYALYFLTHVKCCGSLYKFPGERKKKNRCIENITAPR